MDIPSTHVVIPNITKDVKDFTNPLTDYYYEVEASNCKEKKTTLRIHRNVLTRIRGIVKEIVQKGYYNPIENLVFNKDFYFLNINVNNVSKNQVNLSDIMVFVSEKTTHERYVFSMEDVYRVRCMSETSTGKRKNNNVNKSLSQKAKRVPSKKAEVIVETVEVNNNVEEKPKRTRRRFNSEEERREAIKEYQRNWSRNNKEKLKAARQRYFEKLKAEGRMPKRSNTYKDMERRLAYRKKWLEDNKERIKAYQKKYYKENKKKILALGKKYREENREKRNEYQKMYRERNRKS